MFSSQQTVQVWVSSHVCVYGWFAWGHRCVDRQSNWFYLVVKWKLFQKYFTLCYRLLRGWRTTCNIKRPGLSEPWRCYWCPAQWRCESSESDPNSEVYMKESKTTSWKTSKLSVKAERWQSPVSDHAFSITVTVHGTHLHHTQLSHDPASDLLLVGSIHSLFTCLKLYFSSSDGAQGWLSSWPPCMRQCSTS